jgi:hypothetical protein
LLVQVEEIPAEKYLGFRVWRFIGKCTGCNGHFSFKTDPKAMDYAVENGITRNFEPWRQQVADEEASKAERAEEERLDNMKSLENRTLDSKLALDIVDALEEMRAMRAKQAWIQPEDLLEAVATGKTQDEAAAEAARLAERRGEERADDEIVNAVFHKRSGIIGEGEASSAASVGVDASAPVHKRVIGVEGEEKGEEGKPFAAIAGLSQAVLAPKLARPGTIGQGPKPALPTNPRILIRPRPAAPSDVSGPLPESKRPRTDGPEVPAGAPPPDPAPVAAAVAPPPKKGGLVGYGSDSDSDE